MKEITLSWIDFADKDFQAKEILLDRDGMELIFAFHCQQSIEKLLKAILIENEIQPLKNHDLKKLSKLLPNQFQIPLSEYSKYLDELSLIYIDSRYPSDFALLPNATVTKEDKIRINLATDTIYYLLLNLLTSQT